MGILDGDYRFLLGVDGLGAVVEPGVLDVDDGISSGIESFAI